MKFIEFTVFIARVSFEVYRNTKQHHRLFLHKKVDLCLGPLLKSYDIPQTFSFAVESDGDTSDDSIGLSGDDS